MINLCFDILKDKGSMKKSQLETLLAQYFNLSVVQCTQLNGYDNKNFLIETAAQEKFIVKTYQGHSLLPLLEEESKILAQLTLDINLPKPKKSIHGNWVASVSQEHEQLLIRVLSYVEGEFLAEVNATEELSVSIGSQIALMSIELAKLESSRIQNRKWEWHLNATDELRKKIGLIEKLEVRRVVSYYIHCFEQFVKPQQNQLPKGILHNDFNEHNLLVKANKISGVIDFGDVAYGPRIYDLAIGMVYIAYDKDDYLYWSANLLLGYHKITPLKKHEIRLLFYAMAMRLCMSLCNSAAAKALQPENSYASISETNAENMLIKWLAIGPEKATHYFSQTLELDVAPPPELKKTLATRHSLLSNALSLSYEHPLHLKSAALQYMYDYEGNTYLDAYNNIPHVGHNHPAVVEAAQKQMAKLNTNTRYLYDELHQYAEHLLSYFPQELNKVFFVNSGSEASDLAIRMARYCTKKKKIAVMQHGYHGHTQTGIEVSDYKFSHPKGIGQEAHIVKLPLLTPHDEDQLAKKWTTIENLIEEQREVGALISESILGCAGQVPLAKGYLNKLYEKIRASGGLCIADEVQTGFGRVGTHFWAYEQHNVVPDMVILGKPMGNGHPMGAVVCTENIAAQFSQGVEFFSSFGGNPVSCAIGSAVLKTIEEEDLQKQARITGDYFKKALETLQQKHKCISEIRGSGLFLGIELLDQERKEDANRAHFIKNYLRQKHILIGTDGPYNNVLKSKPPLCFSKANVDRVVAVIDEGLALYQKEYI